VLRKEEAGLDRKMLQFRLTDPEPLLFHNEADRARWQDRRAGDLGQLRPFPWRCRSAWAMCRPRGKADQFRDVLASSTYEIEVAGGGHAAVASLVPMYDPKSERIRARLNETRPARYLGAPRLSIYAKMKAEQRE
jgi:hypothetical protein